MYCIHACLHACTYGTHTHIHTHTHIVMDMLVCAYSVGEYNHWATRARYQRWYLARVAQWLYSPTYRIVVFTRWHSNSTSACTYNISMLAYMYFLLKWIQILLAKRIHYLWPIRIHTLVHSICIRHTTLSLNVNVLCLKWCVYLCSYIHVNAG